MACCSLCTSLLVPPYALLPDLVLLTLPATDSGVSAWLMYVCHVLPCVACHSCQHTQGRPSVLLPHLSSSALFSVMSAWYPTYWSCHSVSPIMCSAYNSNICNSIALVCTCQVCFSQLRLAVHVTTICATAMLWSAAYPTAAGSHRLRYIPGSYKAWNPNDELEDITPKDSPPLQAETGLDCHSLLSETQTCFCC